MSSPAGFARSLACLAILGLPLAAAAQQLHYERPVSAAPTADDIGEDYVTPVVQFHPPRAQWREAADLGLLAGAMALGAWLVLARRSRAGVLLLAVGCLAYFGFYRQGCLCPIGAIQNVATSLAHRFIPISYFTVAIFFLPLLFSLAAGRVFCGVCALGAIQELVLVRPIQVPIRLDRMLRLLKWLYLGLAIALAIAPIGYRDYIICRYDPFVGFFRFTGSLLVLGIGTGLLLLGTVVGRPYCRYLCPYGALLSLTSRLAWRRVSITPNKELDCGLCAEACPYGAIENYRAVAATCLSCARCYKHCPREHVQDADSPPASDQD